eukprot:4937-Heterococcus_DN1.PRE.2
MVKQTGLVTRSCIIDELEDLVFTPIRLGKLLDEISALVADREQLVSHGVFTHLAKGSASVRNSDDSASVAAAGAAAAAVPLAFDLPESDRVLQLFAQQVLPSTSQPEERTRNSPSQASPAAAAATSGAELVLDAQLDARLFTPLLQAVRAGDIELYQALLGHKLLCGRLRSQRTAGSKK